MDKCTTCGQEFDDIDDGIIDGEDKLCLKCFREKVEIQIKNLNEKDLEQ